MSEASAPLVVAIHHPAEVDLAPLRERLADLPRPVDLRSVPYKEKVKLRLACYSFVEPR